FTTSPSTRSPSLNSLRLSSMARTSSSGVRSSWATAGSDALSILNHSFRPAGSLVLQATSLREEGRMEQEGAAGAWLVYRRGFSPVNRKSGAVLQPNGERTDQWPLGAASAQFLPQPTSTFRGTVSSQADSMAAVASAVAAGRSGSAT